VTWRQFNADFHEKQYVAVLRTEGHLVGFSTMVTLPITTAEGTSLHIAFSGDTAVEFAARKSIGFGTTLSSFFRENISTYGDGKVWYVLISKGWRTYKAMEFMFHSFTPHPSREMSTMERSIIAAFGKKRYPLRFNEATGVLSNLDGDQKLKGGSPDLDVPDTNLDVSSKRKIQTLQAAMNSSVLLDCLTTTSLRGLNDVSDKTGALKFNPMVLASS
jgi:hypothetical protein